MQPNYNVLTMCFHQLPHNGPDSRNTQHTGRHQDRPGIARSQRGAYPLTELDVVVAVRLPKDD